MINFPLLISCTSHTDLPLLTSVISYVDWGNVKYILKGRRVCLVHVEKIQLQIRKGFPVARVSGSF